MGPIRGLLLGHIWGLLLGSRQNRKKQIGLLLICMHKYAYFMHIYAYFMHIYAYFMHIYAYFMHKYACFMHIYAYLCIFYA